jgi:dethiobiotin synthetase
MDMADGIFVTGTDTGVGKTYVSAIALVQLRSAGIDVGAMKPVETGCAEVKGELVPADALALSEAAAAGDDMRLVAPLRYKTPVAPFVAARLEGRPIDPLVILGAFAKLSLDHSFVLVEGAGGALVPLTKSHTMLDLAVELALPVLVVAASRLGGLNHSLLTLEACRARGVEIAGLVLNRMTPDADGAQRTNADALRELVREPVVELGPGAGHDDAPELRGLLLRLAGGAPGGPYGGRGASAE